MASPEKKFQLCDLDLARAATLNVEERRNLLELLMSGGGRSFYSPAESQFTTILSVSRLRLLPSEKNLKDAVASLCKPGSHRVKGNQDILLALRLYAIKHNVTGAYFEHDAVPLGRAGRRAFWKPYILEIDGKKYIPYFDPRLKNGLSKASMRFIFSVNNTYIREQDREKYGDVGFVIFQFERLKDGTRRVVAHFDSGVDFLTDKQIGEGIDAVYRLIDQIEAEKKKVA